MPLFDIPTGENGTIAVLKKMSEVSNEATQDPDLIEFTRDLVSHVKERDQFGEADTIYKFVRDGVRYVKDPLGVETLFTPQKLLGLEKHEGQWTLSGVMSGDCDEKASLLASMFQITGLPTRFTAIKTPFKPNGYSHVFTEAQIGDVWYPADSITKHELGWQYPLSIKKLILNNSTGQITKTGHLLEGFGDSFKVVEGIGQLFGNLEDVDFGEVGSIGGVLGEWFRNPLTLIATIAFVFYGMKVALKKQNVRR